MSLNSEQLNACIAGINNHLNPSSRYYGKLLNWKGGDGFWHYGIGLSDDYIFDTGRGLCPFSRSTVEAEFVIGLDENTYSSQQTIERLIHALRCFQGWDYGLLGWNCEHLARLVATDIAISYEVRKQIWPIPELNHQGYHPSAQKQLREYLQKYDPELVSPTSSLLAMNRSSNFNKQVNNHDLNTAKLLSPMQKLLRAAAEKNQILSTAQAALYTGLEPEELQKLLHQAQLAGFAEITNDPETGAIRYYFDL